jgi:chaperonin GroES
MQPSSDYTTSTLQERRETKKRTRVEDNLMKLIEWGQSDNVANDLDEDFVQGIGERVVREFEIDETSRSDWLEQAKKALERAELKGGEKNTPWPNAANVKFPLLTVAGLQFAARAYPAIVDGQKIVKGQVIGDDESGEKRNKAERISRHMSYQLMNEMTEWEEDTDMLLHQLPIVGCVFRKVFYDATLERNRSEMVSALKFVVNKTTTSLETVPRSTQIFELYPHEIEERIDAGTFSDVDITKITGTSGEDSDAPETFLEQHRYLDLNGDGYREPWIVTVHKETNTVVRIVANYDPNALRINERTNRIARIARYNVYVKYPFFKDPSGGFYDLGFGKLLESTSGVIDSTINQMLDAGTLQNAGGGFVGSGLSLKKQQIRVSPGKYHTVQASGGKIRDAVYNHDHPGPSAVLFELLGLMIESGREIANVKDILSGEQNSNAPATTTLALIEQGMKVYTSIYKRIYAALKKEYKLLFKLNAKHLPEEMYLVILDQREAIGSSDYDEDSYDVCPVADPNVVTDAQRLARAQAYLEASVHDDVDSRESLRRYFEAIGADDIDKLLPERSDEPNPLEEIAMKGAAADVATKDAQAKKTEAEATKAIVETEKAAQEVEAGEAKKRQREAKEFQKQVTGQMNEMFGLEAVG